ncbi:MAG TPA: hypothetical protein VFT45_15580 [Longimicrobium sp.]|nr:hypothetical protein [Longimicrobium sp.]
MRIFLSTFTALAVLALPATARAQDVVVLDPAAIRAAVDTTYTVSGTTHADTTAAAVQSLRRTTRNGVDVWEMAYVHRSASTNMVDTTFFAAGTLMPIAQFRQNERHRLAVAFDGPRVTVTRVEGDAEPVVREYRFDQPVYAGSMMDIVYRALPLADGYRTRVPFFMPERGQVYWFDVEVVGMEEVRIRGTDTPAWRVHVTAEGVREVFWISPDTRELLKIESYDGSWYMR